MLNIQGEQVIRHAFLRSDKNAHGKLSPVFVDSVVDDVGIDGASADEPRDGLSERVEVELVLFLPAGMTIDPRDQFTVHELRYQVEGYAPPIRNFFTSTMFRTEVKLKRVTG